MSETKWTPAQAAAIDDRGGTLLVSAAAGSGKTAVLTERAVRLITDPETPVEADRLLIMTFTNAAAAELRARIGAALLERLHADPGNLRLHRQRMLLQRAPICTVDAFCLRLVQQNFAALDVPPDFQTADAGTLDELRQRALGETLEAFCENSAFCDFADLYGKGRTDAAAGRAILQLYDFVRSLPGDVARLDGLLAQWAVPGGFANSSWKTLLLHRAAALAADAEKLYAAALTLLDADRLAAEREAGDKAKTEKGRESAVKKAAARFEKATAALQAACANAALARAAAAGGDWGAMYTALEPWRSGDEGLPGLGGARPSGENKDLIRALAKLGGAAFEKIVTMVCCSEPEAEQDRAAAQPMLAALADAVRDFNTRYTRKKLERKVLEFSDFEHLALRLLRGAWGTQGHTSGTVDSTGGAAGGTQGNAGNDAGNSAGHAGCFVGLGPRTALCEAISAGFDAVMVDEYQDTNALQDALYASLAHPAGDNLFFVGDLKQSIYRFRQADPSIFRAKLEHFAPLPQPYAPRPRLEEGVPGTDALLALDANFRSAENVVDGVNFIFENLMTPALGDTAYGPGQKLVCGVPGDYKGEVRALVLDTDRPADEARAVAARIHALVAAGTPVRDTSKKAVAPTRPARYEDCCILLATRSRFGVYADALAELGIPAYADSAEDLLDAPHIRPLISLLRVIDNPAQDIYLAAVMLGPMFGFTDDDLVRLRALRRKGSLYGAVNAVAREAAHGDAEQAGQPAGCKSAASAREAAAPDAAFAARVAAFREKLAELRALSRTVPVDALMEEIFAATGYLAALGAMENGVKRREDARRFAAFCAGAGSGGVAQLIRAIDATEAAGGLVESAPGRARAGCVTIMTVHRSKGLQFPAVFVADLDHRFNTDDFRRPLLLHRTLGLGLQLRAGPDGGLYPTAAYMALRQAQQAELASEEMRLLYVALTRAQDILQLVVAANKTGDALSGIAAQLAAGAGEALHGGAGKFSTWLLSALVRHPDGHALRRLVGPNVLPPILDERAPMCIEYETAAQQQAEEDEATQLPAPLEADPELTRRIAEGFAWQYPGAALAKVPAKVSVTSIVHQAGRVLLERPAFMSKAGLSGAELGTAMHTFLQHADFAALAEVRRAGGSLTEAIQAEAQRQVDEALLRPELAGRLDTARLEAFFAGPAFARIMAAKQVLREYAFITALPAAAVLAAQQSTGGPETLLQPDGAAIAAADAPVLVQGIADIVLIFDDHLELLDYKTDRRKDAQQLLDEYRAQLNLYARAIEKRYAPKKITYRGIYSLALSQLIDA